MKEIVIISKTNIGIKPNHFGFDGTINPLKKSLSKKLKENLNEYFNKNNMDYITIVENCEPLEKLIKSSAYKILISPYIKDNINLSKIDENLYYILSEEEFLNSHIDNIVNYLEH